MLLWWHSKESAHKALCFLNVVESHIFHRLARERCSSTERRRSRARFCTTPFFSMRAELGGRGLVSEIAHFIAHPDRRTHGIVVQDVRGFFAFAKLRAEIDNRSIITQMLPPTFHEAMQGNFRRMRTTILVKQTGLNRAQARPVLDRALSKVSLWPAPGSVDTRLS